MVKPRENRVPMMLSNEELDAIDNWRFENHVATRSEAIRRLCQLGLVLHSRTKPAILIRSETGDGVVDMAKALQLFDEHQQLVDGFPRNDVERGFEKLVGRIDRLDNTLRELVDQSYAISAPKDLESVLSEVRITTEIYNRMLGRPSDRSHWTMDQVVGKEPPPETENSE